MMMVMMIMMMMDDWCCESFSGDVPALNVSRAGQLIKSGGRSFHSLAVLGKNECLCASILEYGMENRFRKVGLI